MFPMSERNLARFTEADAAEVLGRPITDDEYRRLVKALPYSTMGDAFAEVVFNVCDADDLDED
jgi:hypothetical protein